MQNFNDLIMKGEKDLLGYVGLRDQWLISVQYVKRLEINYAKALMISLVIYRLMTNCAIVQLLICEKSKIIYARVQ